jgi:hypothetical protein
MGARPTKLIAALVFSMLLVGLAPTMTTAHPIPRSARWAKEDVNAYWRDTTAVRYRGLYRVSTSRAVRGVTGSGTHTSGHVAVDVARLRLHASHERTRQVSIRWNGDRS